MSTLHSLIQVVVVIQSYFNISSDFGHPEVYVLILPALELLAVVS